MCTRYRHETDKRYYPNPDRDAKKSAAINQGGMAVRDACSLIGSDCHDIILLARHSHCAHDPENFNADPHIPCASRYRCGADRMRLDFIDDARRRPKRNLQANQ